MATLEFGGIEDTQLSFEEMANLPTSVLDEMLEAAAEVVVEAQKKYAKSYGLNDTGMMIDSIKATNPKSTSDGRALYVYPQGSRTRYSTGKSTRNAAIGFYNEYGYKSRAARPWMETANAQCEDEARAAAEEVFNSYIGSK